MFAGMLAIALWVLAAIVSGQAQSATVADKAREERERAKLLEEARTILLNDEMARSAAAREALAYEIIRLSGVERQLDQMIALTRTMAEKDQKNASSRARLRSALNASFERHKLLSATKKTVADTLDERTLESVLEWYRTPMGSTVTQLEVASRQPASEKLRAQFLNTIEKHLPSETRLSLIYELDLQFKPVEREIEFLKTVLEAMYAEVHPGAKPPPELYEFEKMLRGDVSGYMEDSVLFSYLFTYRSLSDDELKQYVRFVSSPQGEKYIRASFVGLKTAMAEAAASLVRTFPRTTASRK